MKVIAGTVVEGRVTIPAESLAEGEKVMVLVPEAEEEIRLSAEDEDELRLALEEVRRGEFVDGAELLEEVRARSRG